jgi:HupE / UreJ protein
MLWQSAKQSSTANCWWKVYVVLMVAVFTTTSSGHFVNQIYAELGGEAQAAAIEIQFDAGWATPEQRSDPWAPQPKRSWLVEMPREEQVALTAAAADWLRNTISLSSEGKVVGFDLEFSDFRTDPPDFPKLLNGCAYFRVRLVPDEPLPGLSMAIRKVAENDPVWMFAWRSPVTGELNYRKVAAGGAWLIPSGAAPGGASRPGAMTCLSQGFLHVLPGGIDHLLFVLGLFFFRRDWRILVLQSLAFTLGHTATLGIAAAGWVRMPAVVVEPLIAASIVGIAVENLYFSPSIKRRTALVFGFGLLHGLGFASALASWIQPGRGFLVSLVSANAGVELAQVSVLALAWMATARWSDGNRPDWFRHANRGLLIAGLVWCSLILFQ